MDGAFSGWIFSFGRGCLLGLKLDFLVFEEVVF
jgi:hypothetical protein